MPYVDGFIIAVPKQNLETYQNMARLAGQIWKEHGALSYVECLADDVPYGQLTSFPRAVMAREDETVVFAWITYASREERDLVNKKAIEDPRLKDQAFSTLFDGKRMIYGGFRPFLEL
jgi:uncharacterized protein YbaA (DUF1428 family)